MTHEQRMWLANESRLNPDPLVRNAIGATLQELDSLAADRNRLARELAELRAALAKVTTPATLAHVASQPR